MNRHRYLKKIAHLRQLARVQYRDALSPHAEETRDYHNAEGDRLTAEADTLAARYAEEYPQYPPLPPMAPVTWEQWFQRHQHTPEVYAIGGSTKVCCFPYTVLSRQARKDLYGLANVSVTAYSGGSIWFHVTRGATEVAGMTA